MGAQTSHCESHGRTQTLVTPNRTHYMKPIVAVTLIVMGTLLLLAPVGADYLFQRNVVLLRIGAPSANVALIERLNNWYRVGCWLPAALMIFLGVVIAANQVRNPYYTETEDEEEEED